MIDGKCPYYEIYHDSDIIAILDKYPIDKGHSLVITKKPYEKLTDMSNQEVAELPSYFPKYQKLLMRLLKQQMLMHSA